MNNLAQEVRRRVIEDAPENLANANARYRETGDPKDAEKVMDLLDWAFATHDPKTKEVAQAAVRELGDEIRRRASMDGMTPAAYLRSTGIEALADILPAENPAPATPRPAAASPAAAAPESAVWDTMKANFRRGMEEGLVRSLPEALEVNNAKFQETGIPRYADNVMTFVQMAFDTRKPDMEQAGNAALATLGDEIIRRAQLQGTTPAAYLHSQGLTKLAEVIGSAEAEANTPPSTPKPGADGPDFIII